jgi:hypothetical protein
MEIDVAEMQACRKIFDSKPKAGQSLKALIINNCLILLMVNHAGMLYNSI